MNFIPEKNHTAITIGIFDGVHVGHQKLIKRAVDLARKNSIESGVVTFSPYPDEVLKGMTGTALTLDKERQFFMERLGVDFLVVLEFDRGLANVEARDFGRMITRLKPMIIVVGKDFSFGKNRTGSVETLREIFKDSLIEAISLVDVDGKVVKSSTIRNLISKGRMEEAALMLGRLYSVVGMTVKGKGKGKNIGVPTANLVIDKRKLIPAAGVYAGIGHFDNNSYSAGIFINDELALKHQVEVHLIGLDSTEIYGEELAVEFLSYIRAPLRFGSDDELSAQIKRDLSVIEQRILEVERGEN